MIYFLRCLVGLHRWRYTRTERTKYRECMSCQVRQRRVLLSETRHDRWYQWEDVAR